MSDSDDILSAMGAYNNLNDPIPVVNRRETILGIIITFMILSWICGIMRLIVRFSVIYSPGWDDAFLVLYLISTTVGSIVTCLMVDFGLGSHLVYQSAEAGVGFFIRLYISNGMYAMSTTFIKLSLLFQYLRIFRTGKMRKLCIGLIIFISFWGLAYSLLCWVPCYPVQGYWDWSFPSVRWGYGSTKISVLLATYESHMSLTILLDMIVFCIPIPLYFRKDTSSNTRRGLVALVVMAMAVVTIAIWRLVSCLSTRAGTYPTLDPQFYLPTVLILSTLEVDVASICASTPVFWPVFRDQMLTIFVTKEVEVTHQSVFELRDTLRGASGSNSPHGSQVGLRGKLDIEKAESKADIYNDTVDCTHKTWVKH